jgi:transposase
MPKILDFNLTETDLAEVGKAIKKDKRPEVRQRAMGLKMLHEGQSPKEVAQFMSVSLPNVYSWHHRWQENKVEGLAKRPKSGRPRKSNQAYVKVLEETIEQDPQNFGYKFTMWTRKRLRLHLENKTGILLGNTQFRALLKENNYVYRRPKHDLTSLQDADARKRATEWLDELKKKPVPERLTSSLWMKQP